MPSRPSGRWGFDLAEMRVPIQVGYAAGYVLVPSAHGAWLAAQIPGATVLVDGESGRMSTRDERLTGSERSSAADRARSDPART
jgi:hypothetical protein